VTQPGVVKYYFKEIIAQAVNQKNLRQPYLANEGFAFLDSGSPLQHRTWNESII